MTLPISPTCYSPLIHAMMFRASISEQDQDGRTPLHLASAAGNSDLCFYLVTHGASVHSFDRKGKTPAQCASAHVPELGKLLQVGGRGAGVCPYPCTCHSASPALLLTCVAVLPSFPPAPQGWLPIWCGVQADDDTAINALAPWHHFGTTFKRPNEQASAKDFALPMACVPVIFYSFGALYWWELHKHALSEFPMPPAFTMPSVLLSHGIYNLHSIHMLLMLLSYRSCCPPVT